MHSFPRATKWPPYGLWKSHFPHITRSNLPIVKISPHTVHTEIQRIYGIYGVITVYWSSVNASLANPINVHYSACCSILAQILPALLITYKHCWSRTCIAAQYLHEYYLHCWSRTSIVDHIHALLITCMHCLIHCTQHAHDKFTHLILCALLS